MDYNICTPYGRSPGCATPAGSLPQAANPETIAKTNIKTVILLIFPLLFTLHINFTMKTCNLSRKLLDKSITLCYTILCAVKTDGINHYLYYNYKGKA